MLWPNSIYIAYCRFNYHLNTPKNMQQIQILALDRDSDEATHSFEYLIKIKINCVLRNMSTVHDARLT